MKVINLLPKVRQEELKYQRIFRGLLVFVIISLVSCAGVFLIQLGIKVYLVAEGNHIDNQITTVKQQVNKQDNAQIKTEITALNNIVSDYNALASSDPRWSAIIKAFVVLPPEGIQIRSFTANAKTKEVSVMGFSPTRDLVIQFHDRIAADTDHFVNIDYPLENITKPTDISFHFTFYVSDAMLK